MNDNTDKTDTDEEINAICHDNRLLVDGRIRSANEHGCEIVASPEGMLPIFPPGARVTLSLLHEATGLQQLVRAEVSGAFREAGAWVYRLLWREPPELVKC